MRISTTAFRNSNLIFQEPASGFGRRLRGQMPASGEGWFFEGWRKKKEWIEENVIFQIEDEIKSAAGLLLDLDASQMS